MSNYKVDSVVCDYGLFIDNDIVLTCNSRRNALLIKAILEKDDLCNHGDYTFDNDDFNRFMSNLN